MPEPNPAPNPETMLRPASIQESDGLQPLACGLLGRHCGQVVRHGFFTRRGGVSTGIYSELNVGLGADDDPVRVGENRARVCRWFGLPPGRLVTPRQVHSTHAQVIDRLPTGETNGERPQADALVTAVPGVVLGVLTADCGPVLFADPHARVIAAAHAGWRGALGGVLENALNAMERLGASRERIGVCLGPTIGAENYEVGPEFVARFVETDPAHAVHFVPVRRDGHSLFDLPGFIRCRLVQAGVRAGVRAHCTYGDETRFYSYRRAIHRGEPDYGRQISAIALVE